MTCKIVQRKKCFELNLIFLTIVGKYKLLKVYQLTKTYTPKMSSWVVGRHCTYLQKLFFFTANDLQLNFWSEVSLTFRRRIDSQFSTRILNPYVCLALALNWDKTLLLVYPPLPSTEVVFAAFLATVVISIIQWFHYFSINLLV